MRTAILFVLLVFFGLSAYTQHELKINGLYSVFGIPEVTYERNIAPESAIGISAAISIDDDSWWQWGISPYCRFFCGKKVGEGLFLEANGSVYIDYFDDTGAGIGIALGYKIAAVGEWIGELYTGAGLNFLAGDGGLPAYPRIGVCVGRRFGS